MSSPGTRSDVLILGGGLAGSAAAILLARAGRAVTLVERESTPKHKVCGEFLSAEALTLLGTLGINPAALGALPVHSVRLCSASQVTTSELPFAAMSLTRCVLDEALLEAAHKAGAQVLRGRSAESLTHDSAHWTACLNDGTTLSAPDAILATGKHDPRGFNRPPGKQGDLIAMKMYFRLAPAQAAGLAGHVELLLHEGGYTGLQSVPDGAANFCALIRRSVLARLGGGWDALLTHIRRSSPHAAERLAGAEPLLSKPLAVASIPYGFVFRNFTANRLWILGDQAAVIPSFTGDGMSVALFSGVKAAKSVLGATKNHQFQRDLHRDLRFQVARATAISQALVHPWTCNFVITVAALWPGALSAVARATRLPAQATHELEASPQPLI